MYKQCKQLNNQTTRPHNQGTVFQTAISILRVIPRLRPGLLSLRSVLASSQILLAFYDKISIEKNNKKNREKYICLFLFIDIFSHDKTTRQQMQQNCLTIRILSTKKIKEKFANTDYYPYLCIRFSIGKQKERCSSG